ncbi:MAG: helix-turn-helix domain-containing protein [Nocardioidaceae bacterium]
MLGGELIREGRRRAGLTQAELAVRAGTAQSGIARWESGRTAPSLDDVRRLVRLCGFDVEVAIVPYEDTDITQAERLIDLSPQQRIERHQRLTRQLAAAREAQRGT